MNLQNAITNNHTRAINDGIKALYMDKVINAKLNEWARAYNLKYKEPDDILQDAIIILVDKMQNKTFREESNVKTFLLGICRKLILGSVTKKEILDFQEHFQEGDENLKIPSEDTFGDLEKTESQAKRDKTLLNIIEQMDEKCERALKLFYYEKMRMEEIAKTVHLANANQAKKAVSRCRIKLRHVIQANPTLIQLLKEES